MTPKELRDAAGVLFEREVTYGPGPISALYTRLLVPKSTFDHWLCGDNRIPNVVARYIFDLVRWSDDLEDMEPSVREWLLDRLRAPDHRN